MKQLKVMILANDTTYTYNLRREIIERFLADGYRVCIVSKIIKFQQELESLGCQLIDIDSGRHGTNPLSDVILMFNYLKILRKEKPDVVLSYNIKPNVYGGMACRLTGTKYLPNITGLGTAVEYPGKMQVLTTFLYKVGVAGASCVLFQNEENRQFFYSHNMLKKNAKTKLLPGSGVSLTNHSLMEYPKDDVVVNFLFIARVMKEKGIDLYLAAAKRIHEKYPNVVFHICGQCDDERYVQILDEIQKDGYIKYHGEQKDLRPFFEMANCIVHPSYYPEGMSNVLLEAAAHGRPIIATDRSGCRETIDDGKSGFVIPIKDEDALVQAIEKFMKLSWEDKQAMGLSGREKMVKEFDRSIVVEAYVEEMKDL
ncbi:MAG: glycosyltransferase family 4 protein [Agathobacter sp.]|nr:glycosyltransferase family 4 protein [Agathobacter sp.]